MLGCSRHDAIVAGLYAAASGEIEWTEVLGVAADSFGCSAGVLAVIDPALGAVRARAHGKSEDFANGYYASETFRRDPRAAVHMAVLPGQVYHDHALYDVKAMLGDERVRNTIETIGVAHQIGLSLRLPNATPGMFTLLSTEAEGPADEAAVAAFARLVPHIEQACALGEILERSAATQAALLEALASRADGVMLLDAMARPRFVNDGARAILGSGDGLGWSADGFATARGAETRRLRCAVASAINGRFGTGGTMAGGQILVTRPSSRRPYVVRVLPAPPVERLLTRFAFACVIHIHDLAARAPSRPLLAATFGLTERETDLAVELVCCAGLAEAAAAAGMAYNTARNHLQAIFRKCGVTTQAGAVQLFTMLG